jgi:group I intron endonuclease
MNIRESNNEVIARYRDKFLRMDHDNLYVRASRSTDIYYIYVIHNQSNGKKYVGKAKNIYDRAAAYIREHIRKDESEGYVHAKQRPIMQAINNYGIENFIMYPIATCDDINKAGYLEQTFINSLHTLWPEGYNISTTIDTRLHPTNGYPHSVATKILKSKFIACINPDSRDFIIASGMKIFGDFLHTSKDIVKNCARKPCKHRGYFVIYLNDSDRIAMKEKQEKKYANYLNGATYGSIFSDRGDEYNHYVDLVETFLEEPNSEKLMGYKTSFLTYDMNSKPVFTDINVFINNFLNSEEINDGVSD